MSISNIKIYFTAYQLEHINMKHIIIISIFPTKSSKKYFVALSTAFRPFLIKLGLHMSDLTDTIYENGFQSWLDTL